MAESTPKDVAEAAAAIALLEEPTRKRIYHLVRASRSPLTRDAVAAELGITRRLAAFHLDRLLERGLLRASYARPEGRSGPGAGRTSKMYEPSSLEIRVSIPERRYDLVARLLLAAMRAAGPVESTAEAARRVAAERGYALGRDAGNGAPGDPARSARIAEAVLERHGYEPARRDAALLPRNCPFRALAREAPDVVCDMNLGFLEGLARGLGGFRAVAAPEGPCCVELHLQR